MYARKKRGGSSDQSSICVRRKVWWIFEVVIRRSWYRDSYVLRAASYPVFLLYYIVLIKENVFANRREAMPARRRLSARDEFKGKYKIPR